MSKINSDFLKKSIHDMLEERKQRKFVETVELQIGLRDYDSDKRFNGSIRLPNLAHKKVRVSHLLFRSASLSMPSISKKLKPTRFPTSMLMVLRPSIRTRSKSENGPRSTTSCWPPTTSANKSPNFSATFSSR